jgi:hypothetical protein
MPRTVCTVEGCGRAEVAKGLCTNHYYHAVHNGSPTSRQRSERGSALRWLLSQGPSEQGPCRVWPFGTYATGYGKVWVDGRYVGVHRLVCEKYHGPPPSDSHEAAHGCGNRPCFNEHHLRWATRKENAGDKIAHGTNVGNETRGRYAPVPAAIVNLCKASEEMGSVLARKFGISESAVSKWRRGVSRQET